MVIRLIKNKNMNSIKDALMLALMTEALVSETPRKQYQPQKPPLTKKQKKNRAKSKQARKARKQSRK